MGWAHLSAARAGAIGLAIALAVVVFAFAPSGWHAVHTHRRGGGGAEFHRHHPLDRPARAGALRVPGEGRRAGAHPRGADRPDRRQAHPGHPHRVVLRPLHGGRGGLRHARRACGTLARRPRLPARPRRDPRADGPCGRRVLRRGRHAHAGADLTSRACRPRGFRDQRHSCTPSSHRSCCWPRCGWRAMAVSAARTSAGRAGLDQLRRALGGARRPGGPRASQPRRRADRPCRSSPSSCAASKTARCPT
jgi:hypothetical protein